MVLACGLLAVPALGGTAASWVDSVTIGGTPLTAGSIDLRLDGSDAVTSSTLAMPAMVPGSRAAQVFSVGNAGTSPLRWSMTGQLAGGDAAAYASASALKVTVVRGGTRSTTSAGAACTGGTRPDGEVAMAAVAREVGAQRGVLTAGANETVCVEVALADAAPSSLQGRATGLTLVATASSDVG